MIKDEKDMKSIFKEAEITNSFYNFNNKNNSVLLIDKIQSMKLRNIHSFDFPINVIIEFITNSQEIYTIHEKIENLWKEFEKVYKS